MPAPPVLPMCSRRGKQQDSASSIAPCDHATGTGTLPTTRGLLLCLAMPGRRITYIYRVHIHLFAYLHESQQLVFSGRRSCRCCEVFQGPPSTLGRSIGLLQAAPYRL